jgi:O-acetylserine/cysteine efflux transporter
LAYIVIASSLVAHTGYYYLVQRYPVSSIAPITVLSPIFAVLFAVALLGNRLTERLVLGGLITLTGVVVVAMREKKIIDTGS